MYRGLLLHTCTSWSHWVSNTSIDTSTHVSCIIMYVCIHILTYILTYLQLAYVFGKEVIGGTAAPIHYVLILAAAAELLVPVSDPEVGLDKCVTHWTITKRSAEERLRGRGEGRGRGKGGRRGRRKQ